MKSPRIFLAAVAATLLSTAAAVAVPPSADQVTVSGGHQGRYEGKMNALFSSPEERMMFKAQMHQATRGMSREQKKAYRKQQMQQIRTMNDSDKAAWRQSLQAKWDAMPVERRNQMAQKMERHAEKHQMRGQGQGQGQGQYQDDQQDMNAPRR
jgi:hypothetical protein